METAPALSPCPQSWGRFFDIATTGIRLALSRPVAYLSRMRQPAFDPCIPTRGTKVPDRPEWFHEIKHDGYRLIVQRVGSNWRPGAAGHGYLCRLRRRDRGVVRAISEH